MLDTEFLICDRRASARQVQLAQLLALALLLGCIAIFPYRALSLPNIIAFVSLIDAVHFLFAGITAAILLSLASILRSKALMVLGAGFFLAALLAIGHALTYPNLFSRTGLFGAIGDTATWVYLAWHTAFPAAVIACALLKNAPLGLREPMRAISVSLLVTTMLALGIMVLTTAGAPFVTGVLNFGTRESTITRYVAMLLIAIGIALLWFGKRSVLDVGLMLTLWALLTESVAIMPEAGRFSAGWYAGRVMGLLSGLFVLLMLLIDMSRIYGRMAVLAVSQKRERENRLMVGEAVGAFIAHELRQPLASMLLNAGTARQLCASGDGEAVRCVKRAGRGRPPGQSKSLKVRAHWWEGRSRKNPAPISTGLFRDTLRMTAHDRRSRGIKVELCLDDHLPFVDRQPPADAASLCQSPRQCGGRDERSDGPAAYPHGPIRRAATLAL